MPSLRFNRGHFTSCNYSNPRMKANISPLKIFCASLLLTTIQLHADNAKMFDLRAFGATGDGKTLDTEAKPEKQQKNLTKALTKLFKKYPPEAKS